MSRGPVPERPLDRLLPQAAALVFGITALAAGVAGIAADSVMGRPSSTSGVGVVLMFPLVLFAAVIGFAAGSFAGMALRRRRITPHMPMRPYRIVMALVLLAAAGIGATLGARPVIRHERLNAPRVIADTGEIYREPGAADECVAPAPAVLACDVSSGVRAGAVVWNGREVTIGCTREGRITVADADAGVMASADLSDFEYMRDVRAAMVRQGEGRDALALLAGLRATGRRHMLLIFNADGRLIYQELLEGSVREGTGPLAACSTDEAGSLVIDLGSAVTYRAR